MTLPTSGSTVPPASPSGHPLDRAAWTSLTGPHAALAVGQGLARRYPAHLSPFAAIAAPEDPQAWADLQPLYTDDEGILLAGPNGFAQLRPPGWVVAATVPGVQMVATPAHQSWPDDEAVVIGADDAAEAADLVARTEPGPFRSHTYQLGTYLGLRREGRLVALAGERLHPPGWSEISAVCTDPDHRGQGLATRLVRAVSALIRERGETPFLHTAASNTPAIALYLSLGFELRREVEFAGFQAPQAAR